MKTCSTLASLEKHLHIVCLDVPYPPDYGGAIEMFYKIKYLSELGIKIHLHCFEYGRGQQPELNKYCYEVHYYPRNKIISLSIPYIVISRKNNELINRLQSDNYTILLEGIHCTYYLLKDQLKDRNVWVRIHNIEYTYYRNIFRTSTNFVKKIYFFAESVLLKRYEKRLFQKDNLTNFICLNHQEEKYLKDQGARNVYYIPPFYKKNEVSDGTLPQGEYCLFQGNLSVSENEASARYLAENVFSNVDYPLIIAGKNPSERFTDFCNKKGITLKANPTELQMESLLKNAKVHLIYASGSAGVKLKLLYALNYSGYVLCNEAAVSGSGLEKLCTIANSTEEFIYQIKTLGEKEFEIHSISERKSFLNENFAPKKNAAKLAHLIFS